MKKNVIIFNEVSKSYRIYKNKPSTLKEQMVNKLLNKNKVEVVEHKVLQNASFQIASGSTVGIIGRNGAGKSTILKLVSNIIPPDKGEISVFGSVSSLLEIGAGFQPDLSGKENVYLYGSILGLSKKYIDVHYEDIVNFSELNGFMETAVKNYSSGMYMRLAFSVAIHVNPEILVIDEVLAVGDADFQKKCFKKIREFKRNGKTIVFVSHDMTSVRDLCDQVIFVDKEGLVKIGDTDSMVNLYYTKIYGSEETVIENEVKDDTILELDEFKKHINLDSYKNPANRWGNKEIIIQNVYFSDTQGIVGNVYQQHEDIVINVQISAKSKQENVVVGVAIYDEKGTHLSGPNSKQDGLVIHEVEDKKNFKIILKKPTLLQGTYLLTLAIYDFNCTEPFDFEDKYYKFSIINNREEYGIIKLDCDWLF